MKDLVERIEKVLEQLGSGKDLDREMVRGVLGTEADALSDAQIVMFDGMLKGLPEQFSRNESALIVAQAIRDQFPALASRATDIIDDVRRKLEVDDHQLSWASRKAFGLVSRYHEAAFMRAARQGRWTADFLARIANRGATIEEAVADEAVARIPLRFRVADTFGMVAGDRDAREPIFCDVGAVETSKRPFDVRVTNELELAFLGALETETIDWIKSTASADSIFYDVGANIGLYSLFTTSYAAGATAVCFEPEPMNFCRLCENLHLNADRAIEAFPVALSDTVGLTKFGISFNLPGGSSHRGITPEGREWAPLVQTVGCVTLTLDTFIEWFRPAKLPTHLKIDVDGPELKVLAGAKTLLGAPELKHVLVEYRDDEERQRGTTLLRPFGFDQMTSNAVMATMNIVYEKRSA